MIDKIVSGAQTGADRAGLDVALELGLATGGWVPRGRRAEDGIVPEDYPGLEETTSNDYAERTRLNVRDSDATIIFTFGEPTGGTALTVSCARALKRPLLVVDLERVRGADAVADVRRWLADTGARVLNVAGPRLSKEPRIAACTADILRSSLSVEAGPGGSAQP